MAKNADMSALAKFPSTGIAGMPSSARAIAVSAATKTDSWPHTRLGMYALNKVNLFELPSFPADARDGVGRESTALLDPGFDHCSIHCEARRRACFHML
ncbi:hypothetical protein PY254_10865 [Rhodanobacter sp. AS-Z3]|uniref:hypothetical protein n=1 Tax=Rhodanobacter sp. AS-Z3 TaxID=3031330 RepID=UPI002478EA05|nr:hypothetical protein [Rhodanobacter sp. AS-Z3]WEN13745.1 hypothetical protein PY254_10865 [Rhodanobacter sp. AS-Z3]